jgi:hypothetical protein
MTVPSASTTVSRAVLAHRAVAHRRRPRRPRCGHPADGRVRTGIHREGEPGVVQRLVQLLPRDAGFDRRVEIVRADAQDLVHVAEIDRDAAADGVHVPSSDVPAPNGTIARP